MSATKELVLTYEAIRGYKHYPSKNWLALAEFIDNSIASWQGKGNIHDNVSGLEIKIIFDNTDESNKKITIIDNANGMNDLELVNAMQPHDREGKQDNHYNQYGVGMKVGIFWFGQDVRIYSKRKDDLEYETSLITSSVIGDTKVEPITATPSNKNMIKTTIGSDSGTHITIENIYDEKWIKPREIDSICSAFGWRYRKFLESEDGLNQGMKIILHWITLDKKAERYERIFAQTIQPITLSKFIEIQKNKKSFNFNEFQQQYERDIHNLMEISHDNTLLIKFLNKLKNNEPLYDTYEIDFDNGKKAKLLFGVIGEQGSKSGISGVTTFHGKRAIHHPPNDDKLGVGCIQFNKNITQGSSGDPTWRRLFGEIDLTDIEVPDQNKKDFIWVNKDELHNKLQDIWDYLIELLKMMVKWEKYTGSISIESKTDKQKIINYSEQSLDINIVHPSLEIDPYTNQENITYLVKFDDVEIKIWIEEDKSISFIDQTIDKNTHNWRVKFNPDHKFWRPFITEKSNTIEYRGNSIYPTVLLMALSTAFFENEEYSGALENDFGYGIESFQDVINFISNYIVSKGTNDNTHE